MSTAGKIFRVLKILLGVLVIVASCYQYFDAALQGQMSWGRYGSSPTWYAQDDPFHYFALLATRVAAFVGGLWLVFGSYDRGKYYDSDESKK